MAKLTVIFWGMPKIVGIFGVRFQGRMLAYVTGQARTQRENGGGGSTLRFEPLFVKLLKCAPLFQKSAYGPAGKNLISVKSYVGNS